MADEVTYEVEGQVAIVTLNRPAKLNALNVALASGLEAAWQRFEAGPERVAVVTGAGGNFSAGIDVSEPPARPSWSPQLGVRVGKPVIAAVEGWCVGAGLILSHNADLCIAGETARFRYPEGRLGLTRGLVSGMAARMPYKLAMEILLVGRPVSAQSMYRAGFVNEVTVAGGALALARELADEIALADPDAVRFIKAGIDATVPRGLAEMAEALRWESDQLPANRRLVSGGLTVAQLRGV